MAGGDQLISACPNTEEAGEGVEERDIIQHWGLRNTAGDNILGAPNKHICPLCALEDMGLSNINGSGH